MTPEMIGKVESLLGYVFADKSLLIRALTRKAYAQEQRQRGQVCEDQEFYRILGDATLKFILVEMLFQLGYMSRAAISIKKSDLESRKSLGKLSIALAIAPFMRLGAGEKKQQVDQQSSVVGETFEAVIAAIYQDGGLEMIRKLIQKWFVALSD
jgi:ribonuclease III